MNIHNAYNKKFAPFYDKNWHDFSVRVFDFFKKEIKNKNICDVACGTGNFIKISKTIAKSICGIDSSKDFVAYAKNKNQEIDFRVIDIGNWNDKNKYDIVFCLYDSVNHFNDWERAFQKIYDALKINGNFIFDINTVLGLKKWDGTYLNETKDGYIYTEGKRLLNNSASTRVKIFNKNGHLVAETEVVEKTYPVGEIVKILKLVGFRSVKNLGNIISSRNKGRNFFKCLK